MHLISRARILTPSVLFNFLTIYFSCIVQSHAFVISTRQVITTFVAPSSHGLRRRNRDVNLHHFHKAKLRDDDALALFVSMIPTDFFTDDEIMSTPSSSFTVEITQLLSEMSQESQDISQLIQPLSPTTTTTVFIIGIIPFLWATYEFWRRIAFGESFGTGSDSVKIPSPFFDSQNDNMVSIGEDGNPNSSRGRRTLDKSSLTVAYILFAVAASSIVIAVASVIVGPKVDFPL